MCDFKPGDEVVCINGGVGHFAGIGWVCLAEGATYTVAEIARAGDIGETGGRLQNDCIQVVELGRLMAPPRWGFRADRFRKVQRHDLRTWLQNAATNTDHLDRPIKTPARPKVDALLKRVQSGAFG